MVTPARRPKVICSRNQHLLAKFKTTRANITGERERKKPPAILIQGAISKGLCGL